jgi:hypothetical protein
MTIGSTASTPMPTQSGNVESAKVPQASTDNEATEVAPDGDSKSSSGGINIYA